VSSPLNCMKRRMQYVGINRSDDDDNNNNNNNHHHHNDLLQVILAARSTVARLLRLWVRIPPGAWIFVCISRGVLPTVARRRV
jgi:hypothetical protein